MRSARVLLVAALAFSSACGAAGTPGVATAACRSAVDASESVGDAASPTKEDFARAQAQVLRVCTSVDDFSAAAAPHEQASDRETLEQIEHDVLAAYCTAAAPPSNAAAICDELRRVDADAFRRTGG